MKKEKVLSTADLYLPKVTTVSAHDSLGINISVASLAWWILCCLLLFSKIRLIEKRAWKIGSYMFSEWKTPGRWWKNGSGLQIPVLGYHNQNRNLGALWFVKDSQRCPSGTKLDCWWFLKRTGFRWRYWEIHNNREVFRKSAFTGFWLPYIQWLPYISLRSTLCRRGACKLKITKD